VVSFSHLSFDCGGDLAKPVEEISDGLQVSESVGGCGLREMGGWVCDGRLVKILY